MLSDVVVTVLVGAVGLIVAANLIAYGVFWRFPSLLVSENERLQAQYLARFSGPLRPYIPEWFGIAAEDWDEFRAEYAKGEKGVSIYADYVGFKHPPFTGKYLNRTELFRQNRVPAPWPPSPAFTNIFFFGSSTTLHPGPDWTTAPSYLQDLLNADADTVRVYNFGRGAYVSTQERILFQQLLLDGHVPDLAIFLDGANDFYWFEGQTAVTGFFADKLDQHNRDTYEQLLNQFAARPKWRKLLDFADSLPVARALELVGKRLARRNAAPEAVLYKPIPIADERLVPAVHRFLANTRQARALAREYGVEILFAVQPTAAYKYDLQHHVALNAHYGLGGHERSGQGYRLLADELAKRGMPADFLWLADMQVDLKRPLYIDNVHYTAEMNRLIAAAIAEALATRRLARRADRTLAPAGDHA